MAYGDQAFTGVVDSSGALTITVRPSGRQTWTVSQVSVEMASAPSGASCMIRKNGSPISPVIASGDAAAGDPPVILRPSDRLTVEWTGATAGLIGRVFIIYDDGN